MTTTVYTLEYTLETICAEIVNALGNLEMSLLATPPADDLEWEFLSADLRMIVEAVEQARAGEYENAAGALPAF